MPFGGFHGHSPPNLRLPCQSQPHRPDTLVRDRSRTDDIDAQYKAGSRFKNSVLIQDQFTTKNDPPVNDPSEFYAHHQSTLFDVMKEVSHFTKYPG